MDRIRDAADGLARQVGLVVDMMQTLTSAQLLALALGAVAIAFVLVLLRR